MPALLATARKFAIVVLKLECVDALRRAEPRPKPEEEGRNRSDYA
jgi:hypothetical protein